MITNQIDIDILVGIFGISSEKADFLAFAEGDVQQLLVNGTGGQIGQDKFSIVLFDIDGDFAGRITV